MSYEGIPECLRERAHWTVWRREWDEAKGKYAKTPYVAEGSRRASCKAPRDWCPFETAIEVVKGGKADGVGYALQADDELVFVDLDDVISEAGELHEAAAGIVNVLGSYTEVSQSGSGLHVLVSGVLPDGTRHRKTTAAWGGDFEVYSTHRFAYLTGQVFEGHGSITPARPEVLQLVLDRIWPPRQDGETPARQAPVTDQELLRKAFAAKNGKDLRALYDGDASMYVNGAGNIDRSRADFALLARLVFWTGPDPERLERLLLGSGLAHHEGGAKWDRATGRDYLRRTIQNVIERHGGEYFDWSRTRPKAPSPKSSERTERSPENPVNTGDSAFGPQPNADRTVPNAEPPEPPELAGCPRILDKLDKFVASRGLIGERHIARANYLVHISRLLPDPARAITKGDSSTGKSFAVDCALEAAAPEYLWQRTSTSPLALFYSEESFRHRTLAVFEANKLADDDDDFARVLRTLLSEGVLRHEVTDAKSRTSVLVEKEGPVAFISTIARASLDKEIETRVLSLYSDGSDEQTKSVVQAILNDAADPRPAQDASEWHQLDRWLASRPAGVVVPWAPALASFELSGPPRLRRDITNMLALVRAHALLHRATRETDGRGRVLANLDDYEVVRELLGEALAIATDKAVRSGTRDVVGAVAALRKEGRTPVSLKAASRKAGKSASTTHTDVHDALDRGYLVNRSKSDRSYDLDLGEPLPDQRDLLPSRAHLEEAVRARSVSVRSTTERESPIHTGDSGDRSVRSVDSEGEGYEPATAEELELAERLFAEHEEGSP